MPITYHIDQTTRIIHTTCSGQVSMAEVSEHFRELEQAAKRPRQLHVLLDLSKSTSLPDSNQIKAVSYAIGAIRKSVQFGFCAIVAANDAMFGMSRMLEVFAAPYFLGVHVFRGAGEAEAWLLEEVQGIRAAG